MTYETDIILRHRCRLARQTVRAACGWCEHCERTERGAQRPLARTIGVDPGALCQFIAGRDISGKFLVAVEAWAAEAREKQREWERENGQ